MLRFPDLVVGELRVTVGCIFESQAGDGFQSHWSEVIKEMA